MGVRGRIKLLQELTKQYDRICILGNEILQFEELAFGQVSGAILGDFAHFEILEFGHQLRSALIEKWYSLGVEFIEEPFDIEKKVTAAESVIDALLGKSFLPSFPISILTTLQAIESATPVNSSAGTYGKLYEVLITQELAGCKATSFNFDTRQTYLSDLAFWMFSRSKRRFTDNDWLDFHDEYVGTYRVPYAKRDFEQDFTRAGIIQKRDELFEFRHPYVYYYFVARYFRDHLHKNETKRTVSELCDKLYIEEHSSIWLFLTHLSKDPFIVSCIAEHANAAVQQPKCYRIGSRCCIYSGPVRSGSKNRLGGYGLSQAKGDTASGTGRGVL